MRNPKLPAYAWQLSNSALTPEKPIGSGSNNNNTISSTTVFGSEQKSVNDDVGISDVGAVSSSPNINHGNNNRLSGGSSANGAIVAPVQFDWSSSGLRNPLCEGKEETEVKNYYCIA